MNRFAARGISTWQRTFCEKNQPVWITAAGFSSPWASERRGVDKRAALTIRSSRADVRIYHSRLPTKDFDPSNSRHGREKRTSSEGAATKLTYWIEDRSKGAKRPSPSSAIMRSHQSVGGTVLS